MLSGDPSEAYGSVRTRPCRKQERSTKAPFSDKRIIRGSYVNGLSRHNGILVPLCHGSLDNNLAPFTIQQIYGRFHRALAFYRSLLRYLSCYRLNAQISTHCTLSARRNSLSSNILLKNLPVQYLNDLGKRNYVISAKEYEKIVQIIHLQFLNYTTVKFYSLYSQKQPRKIEAIKP